MDEHLVVREGRTVALEHDLEERNLNDLKWWKNKQALLGGREGADVLLARARQEHGGQPVRSGGGGKRGLKERCTSDCRASLAAGVLFVPAFASGAGLDGRPVDWHVLGRGFVPVSGGACCRGGGREGPRCQGGGRSMCGGGHGLRM